MSKRIERCVGVRIVVMLVLFGTGMLAWGQEAGSRPRMVVQPAPRKTPVKPKHLELPPLPPDREFVMKMAFSRFMGVDQKKTLTFIDTYLVDEIRVVREATSVRPNRAVDMMTDVIQKALRLQEIEKNEPLRFGRLVKFNQLERQVQIVKKQIDESEGKSRELKMEELNRLLVQAFDVRQSLIKMEVESLAGELGKLRTLVRKREENKNAIINRRLVELTGEEDFLKW